MATDLEARLVTLEASLAELRVELARVTAKRLGSMRQTLRCPACGGGKLFHIRAVKDITDSGTTDLALQKEISIWGRVKLNAGVLEAYACRSCRLVEWCAASLDNVEADGEDVLEVNAPVEPELDDGPYRG
jgi:hypothetical protein